MSASPHFMGLTLNLFREQGKYLSIHAGDPADSGLNELPCARQPMMWQPTEVNKVVGADVDIDFPSMPETSVGGHGVWDAPVGGNYLWGGPTEVKHVNEGDIYRVRGGSVVASFIR